jgi:hypothetical protein
MGMRPRSTQRNHAPGLVGLSRTLQSGTARREQIRDADRAEHDESVYVRATAAPLSAGTDRDQISPLNQTNAPPQRHRTEERQACPWWRNESL